MCQGTVENWCADDDVNMAVRAGGNIEYGREPDFEGWIRWRQQENYATNCDRKSNFRTTVTSLLKGFRLAATLSWLHCSRLRTTTKHQLQSMQIFQSCKGDKVQCKDKQDRCNRGCYNLTDRLARDGAYQHNWQMQRVSPHSCSVQCQPPGKTTTLQQPAQQHYHWSKLTGKNREYTMLIPLLMMIKKQAQKTDLHFRTLPFRLLDEK